MVRNFFCLLHCALIVFFLDLGCKNNTDDSKHYSYLHNMDNDLAWNNHNVSNIALVKIAHSGTYACKLDSGKPYSPVFTMRLKDVSSNPLKNLTISAWFFLQENDTDPHLVADFRNGNDSSFQFENTSIGDMIIEKRRWTKASVTIDLTTGNKNNLENILRVYAYNSTLPPLWCDDLEINFSE
jgi:hypothetical protein